MRPLSLALAARGAVLPCLVVALAGCATPAPPPAPPTALLHDALFQPAPAVPDAASVFALSPAMRDYADRELADPRRHPDPRAALVQALYHNRLRLSYDASSTRNAAQAFEARSGNCLSLVIMTAAFARHLGVPASYQVVQTDAFYSRSGNLTMASGHVNLVLAPPVTPRSAFTRSDNASLTIDFLPQEELRGQAVRPVDEPTIVAMYLNNRAAELLGEDRLAEAYWHARAALLHAPAFAAAANTLGVIYNRAGQPGAAEAAFRHTLATEPANTSAMGNLVLLLQRQERPVEAAALADRLAQLQPVPPFQHYQQGRQAMEVGDYARARDHFLRELRLQPYQDEVHFWVAQAYWRLGETDLAARHLARALSYSPTPGLHDRYAAKLDWLRHQHLQ